MNAQFSVEGIHFQSTQICDNYSFTLVDTRICNVKSKVNDVIGTSVSIIIFLSICVI